MSPKYISLCLLLGIVLLATTSLADLSGDDSSVSAQQNKMRFQKLTKQSHKTRIVTMIATMIVTMIVTMIATIPSIPLPKTNH
ncbi:hypothetical protein P8452_07130 [Trifolium repens]|nr:hypothetical protein P8452_07130 [Trifolium repens]